MATDKATGLVVAPGFIDPHSHADESPLERSDDTSKIFQGVTTEVVGNCGKSPTPDAGFNKYYEQLDSAGYVTNYCPLVGHGTLRTMAMGMRCGEPNAVEARQMDTLLDAALDAGVWGMSSGLVYAPGCFSNAEELTRLAQRLPAGAVYATHMRNEGQHLSRSIQEAITVGQQSDVRLQISHLKAAGRPAWGKVTGALAEIDRARDAGVDVNQDVYPYDASSTVMLACLPPWFLEGSDDAVLARLGHEPTVRRAHQEVEGGYETDWENIIAGDGYERIVISSTHSHKHEGETLADLAKAYRTAPFDALIRLLKSERLRVTMVDFSMTEDDMLTVLKHPHTSICTDGMPIDVGGKPHPRLYGSFPRVLGLYVRERSIISLESAVHKMTGHTASVFRVPQRGRLIPGLVADLVIFDPSTIAETGTYSSPSTVPAGIEWVIQAGKPVVHRGMWMGTRRGVRLEQNFA